MSHKPSRARVRQQQSERSRVINLSSCMQCKVDLLAGKCLCKMNEGLAQVKHPREPIINDQGISEAEANHRAWHLLRHEKPELNHVHGDAALL